MTNHPVQDSRTHIDERKFARRRIPLSAKMTDVAGKLVIACTIRDMSMVGAQVSLPMAEPIPETVYLVDITNRAAYKANVVWWRPHSVGLAFQETIALDEQLPSKPEFLKRVWMEAKLEEVDTLMADGRSLVEAVQMAGMSGATYARWNGERANDDDLMQRLWKLETENLSLRKLVTELTGKAPISPDDLPKPLPARRPIAG